VRGHDPEVNLLKAVLNLRSFDQAIFRGLRGHHFRDPLYGAVWEYLRDHHQRFGVVPAQETVLVDHPTVKDYLSLARAPEPPAFYADQILETYAKSGVAQRLLETLPTLERDVSEGMDAIGAVLSEYRVIRTGAHVLNLANTGRQRLDAYESEQVYGIPFGWDTLDTVTMGAHAGDLISLVARAGLGKTWITLAAAHTAWRGDARVLFVATEVPALRIMARFDALHLRLDYDLYKKRMITKDDATRLREHMLAEDPAFERFMVVDGIGMRPSELVSLVEQHKPDIVYVDSFYKLEPDKSYDSRQQWMKIAHLANELKDNLAMRFSIPVFVNTQFNREVGTAHGKSKNLEGGLEHIAGGDELGRASDLVLAVSRSIEEIQEKALALRIIKGRETEDGVKFHVRFDFHKMTFDEIDILYPPEDAEREEQAATKGLPW
jgi:hypothetical protein